jgi:hypothetical protein
MQMFGTAHSLELCQIAALHCVIKATRRQTLGVRPWNVDQP